jgi:hypothetical protein
VHQRLLAGLPVVKIGVVIERAFMRLSHSRRIDGTWVGVYGDRSDRHLLCRVEEALMLIKQHDAVRYRRVHRDIDGIWVHPLPTSRGQFISALNRCDLDRRFVAISSPTSIAATIVHEAAHAHPCLRKIGYPEALRYRIEQICMRQELAFARRLPDGTEIRVKVEKGLGLEPSFWSEETRRRLRRDGELAMAREAGMPDWLTKLCQFIARLRERLHRSA